jgi:hypothetical protein
MFLIFRSSKIIASAFPAISLLALFRESFLLTSILLSTHASSIFAFSLLWEPFFLLSS